jgi:Flp pilus assembly protein TadG
MASVATLCAPRRRRSERGSTAVEFAIILPVLILLVFGIIEFSIAYNHQQGLHAAAREGARVASLPQSDQATITARVRSALQGVLSATDIQNATITVTPSANQPCSSAAPGTDVVVTVSAPNQLDIPLFTNSTMTLTGRGEFLCE